ncbi:MAG: glutamine synthetase [Bacteroidales bacterium]|nr:glutamine synthetase [Bacteroidales bacterium]
MDYKTHPNELVRFLQKPRQEFTKADIISFIRSNNIEMLNFRYGPEDGKLKTLNFVLQGDEHLEDLLSFGERVDGSSLFSFIEAGSSDLYLIPRFSTAFLNPFSPRPTLDLLCSFYNNEGLPLENSPEFILRKAHEHFSAKTGMEFLAMGELEYYVNSPKESFFLAENQKGYQNSGPFAKWMDLRTEAMYLIAKAGGNVKYAHGEVGSFCTETEAFEQHEIEFLPSPVQEAADQLVIAKWILRMLAWQRGVEISFAPKIYEGKAGSGLHIHMMLEKDKQNMMSRDGKLSDTARSMIAGILDMAPALTAFGNTIPTSYLRLVPHQEAPTYVCWGDRNRSVLVRVPLGWLGNMDMLKDANPQEPSKNIPVGNSQTVEFRVPDGSADIYNLLAGLVLASLHGLEMKNSLELANSLYVGVDIFKNQEKLQSLNHLPFCCYDSAEALDKKRDVFEKSGVFSQGMIDNVIRRLKAYDDQGLSEKLHGDVEKTREMVLRFIHVM